MANNDDDEADDYNDNLVMIHDDFRDYIGDNNDGYNDHDEEDHHYINDTSDGIAEWKYRGPPHSTDIGLSGCSHIPLHSRPGLILT